MKKEKGFTLVELLAVIVVLAIIMVIAIPAVMNSLSKAKKKSFILYGEKVLNAAQTKYQTDVDFDYVTVDDIYGVRAVAIIDESSI